MEVITMSNVSIPREPDVVTILWQCNPLRPGSAATILEAQIVGRAIPCTRFLRQHQSLCSAKDCLLDKGFKEVFEEDFGVFGISVFVRETCFEKVRHKHRCC
jgi:hypothetical protein